MTQHGEFIGKYKMRNFVTLPGGKEITLWESDWFYNLITNAGRAHLLNRLKDNSTSNPISHMALGNPGSPVAPALADTTLQTESVRVALSGTVVTASAGNYKVTYTAQFTATQINGTKEIGLLNASSNGTLVTRNVHEAISIPVGSSMAIDYVLALATGTVVTSWEQTSGYLYETPMASGIAVKGVNEVDTDNGYVKKTNSTDVSNNACSYWHDTGNNKLYIRCSGTTNPSAHTIMVTSGG